jgi:hypothetical protein
MLTNKAQASVEYPNPHPTSMILISLFSLILMVRGSYKAFKETALYLLNLIIYFYSIHTITEEVRH